MVHLIDDLENLGLLQRQRNPRDRCSHNLVLTEQGKQMSLHTRQQVTLADEDLLRGFTPQERQLYPPPAGKICAGTGGPAPGTLISPRPVRTPCCHATRRWVVAQSPQENMP